MSGKVDTRLGGLPLSYLERWPYPVFIFSTAFRSPSPESPSFFPTLPSPIWSSSKWSEVGQSHSLADVIDEQQAQAILAWLQDEGCSATSARLKVSMRIEGMMRWFEFVKVEEVGGKEMNGTMNGGSGGEGEGEEVIVVHTIERLERCSEDRIPEDSLQPSSRLETASMTPLAQPNTFVLPSPMSWDFVLEPILPPIDNPFPENWHDIDWASTTLGAESSWPPYLKTIISLVMATPTEAAFYHSKEYHMYHNRPFAKLLPGNPKPFGNPARIGWWRTWERLGYYLDRAWDDKPVAFHNDLWFFSSPDHPFTIETYHRWYMIPVKDDTGRVVGVLNQTVENTADYIYRRRTQTLAEIGRRIAVAKDQHDFFKGVAEGASLRASATDIPYLLMYSVEVPDAAKVTVQDLEDARPLDPMPAVGSEIALNLKLMGSVGANAVKNPDVAESIEVRIPQRVLRKRHFESKALESLDESVAGDSEDHWSSVRSTEHRSATLTGNGNGAEDGKAAWPIREAILTGKIIFVADATKLSKSFEIRSWERLPQSAVVIPLMQKSASKIPNAVLILGLNVHRPWNDIYKDYVGHIRTNLTDGLAAAKSYEAEIVQRGKAKALVEAQSRFISNSAHELRSPLTLLLGPIADILNSTKESYTRSLAKTADRSCQRLQKLVSSLLDYSRLDAGRLKGTYRPMQVGLVTEEIVTVFQAAPTIRSGKVKLKVDCQRKHKGQSAFIDPDLWERIVTNMVSNSVKYTQVGQIHVKLSYGVDTCQLSVADTGIGIPKGEIHRVTERFFRSQSSERYSEGTGIGLSYTLELVKMHGGHLKVQSNTAAESEDGSHGSVFTVIFPLGYDHLDRASVDLDSSFTCNLGCYGRKVVDEECQTPDNTESLASEPTNSTLIRGMDPSILMFDKANDLLLICDDNSDMRQYIYNLFAPFVKVELAADGLEGLELARKLRPSLILSDVSMPRMSGTEMLQAVRADPELESTPIILLTALAGEDDRVDGLLSGADDYMAKPFKSREIIARVNMQMQMGKRTRQLRDRFEAKSEEMRILMEYAPIGIIRTSAEGQFVYCNPAWFDMTQLPRILPLPDWSVAIMPEDLQKLSEEWIDFLAGDVVSRKIEWRWITGRYVTATCLRLDLINPALAGTVCSMYDSTNEKLREIEQAARLEEQRKQTEEAIAERQRNELLIDVTSHELRNPISAVLQCSQLVDEELRKLIDAFQRHVNGQEVFNPDAALIEALKESQDAVDSIYQCGISQSRICDDVLSLGKLQMDKLPIHMLNTNVHKEVDKIVRTFAVETRKLGIRLEWNLGSGLTAVPWVKMDPVRFGQCASNLISNSIKFLASSETRHIKLDLDISAHAPETDSCLMPKTVWDMKTKQSQLYLYCSVKDTGPGLTQASLAKLFHRFAQASRQTHAIFGGSGLGLFICRRLTELMGGRIEVDSTLGSGSDFRFFIAVEAGMAEGGCIPHVASPIPRQISPDHPERKIRVCIVEDNLINQKVLNKQLTKAGFATAVANNGQEGLELIRAESYAAWDIVLMDLEMPVMDGLTAIRKLRQEERDLGWRRNTVIAVTGNAREAHRLEALEAGFDDVTIKPYRIDKLLALIYERFKMRSANQNQEQKAA